MDAYKEAAERYRKYLSAGQKRKLEKKARALSLANAAARAALQKKDLERVRKANALLVDYGLAASLTEKPSSGEDAAARRMSETETGGAALYRKERAALFGEAESMKRQTLKKREEAKKKKSRKNVRKTEPPAAEEAAGLPGRTVTVRKL